MVTNLGTEIVVLYTQSIYIYIRYGIVYSLFVILMVVKDGMDAILNHICGLTFMGIDIMICKLDLWMQLMTVSFTDWMLMNIVMAVVIVRLSKSFD